MGAFGVLDIAASGANVHGQWLQVLAHNLANVNTIRPADEEPFREILLHAQEDNDDGGIGEGVRPYQLVESQADPTWVYDPDHPLASEEGYVVRPVVEMAGQMSDLIVAQRGYQMNIQVIRAGEEAYQAALRIGRQ